MRRASFPKAFAVPLTSHGRLVYGPMHKLLVPVDGSDSALRAVEWAAALAGRTRDIAVHLVHVGLREAGLQERVLDDAERTLQRNRVPYTKELLSGPVAAMIAEHAAKAGCEAIVMGTRGTSAVESLLVGSVAAKVIQLTRLPVTLVK